MSGKERFDGEDKGVVFDIQNYAVHDGEGIRTLVFLKGCPLQCLWCQNPEGQRMEPEIGYYKARCVGCGRCIESCPQNAIVPTPEGKVRTLWERCNMCGICATVCPSKARVLIGRYMKVSQVVNQVMKDSVFYRRSGGGVTLSGGDPVAQPTFSRELLSQLKNYSIHTAIETSGYLSWEEFEKIIEVTDLVLYDFKQMDSEKHKAGTGVSNELILDNAKRISRKGKMVIARIPLIPSYNDDEQNIVNLAKFLQDITDRVDILPYHTLGTSKYEALGMTYQCGNISPPSPEMISKIKKWLESYNLNVNIEGFVQKNS